MDENSGTQESLARPARDVQTVDPVAEPSGRPRIPPKETLGPLEPLRIEKMRIKPLETGLSKAGGKADVEAAELLPRQFPNPSESSKAEYIAVKKLRVDETVNDDRVLVQLAHEVGLLKDLSHDNVVHIVGFVQEAKEGIAWLIFDWEKNGNLREFVTSGNWELPERISLINDVAKGLSYLHSQDQPICHGDLKSLNVLVNSAYRAVITDFGSARRIKPMLGTAVKSGTFGTDRRQQTLTIKQGAEAPTIEIASSGEFITMTGPAWTLRWAAPELLHGDLPGLPSDIWALGWICWEVITGNFPFAEENDVAAALRIVKGEIPAIYDNSELSQIKALCSLMMDCWQSSPRGRPSALECQRSISWMHQVVPSDRGVSGAPTTRSSRLLYALGLIQLSNGMMGEALNLFHQSLDASRSVGDNQGYARAMRGLGDVYRLKSEYSEAENSYIKACDIYAQIRDEIGQAGSFKALGDIYRMRNDYTQAEDSYTKARGIYAAIENQLGLAQSVQGLGHVYHMRNEYPKAEASYAQARDIYARIGDQLGLANSVRGLGHVYRMRNEYGQAELHYIEAREIYSRIGDQLGAANSERGLGDVYQMQHEYSKAKESYTKAREAYSRIGEQLGLANSARGLGDVHRMRNESEQAESSYTEARDIYRRLGNRLGLAQSVQGLGDVHRMRGEYTEAEALYLKARDVYLEIGDQLCLANVAQGLGHVYSARGELSMAEHSYLEAQEIYDEIGDAQSLANISRNLKWLRGKQARRADSVTRGSRLGAVHDSSQGGMVKGVADHQNPELWMGFKSMTNMRASSGGILP